MLKIIFVFCFLFIISCQSSTRTPQAVEGEVTRGDITTENNLDFDISGDNHPIGLIVENSCVTEEATNFASNKPIVINGKNYPEDTHFTIRRNGADLEIMANFDDQSGAEKDEFGSYDIIPQEQFSLGCKDLTSIPLTKDKNGELVLGEYSLPVDFAIAAKKGTKPKTRKKKGGVTYCYREVKRIVRKKVTLTGGSAYMAAPQLEAAGFKKITDYKAAPNGAICVFGPGGRKTASGGHKHGHIGIKGMGGVVNPAAGFTLGRPFIGCYVK